MEEGKDKTKAKGKHVIQIQTRQNKVGVWEDGERNRNKAQWRQ